MTGPRTLPELLHAAAARWGDRTIRYLEPDQPDELQTYAALLSEAEQHVGGLLALGLPAGAPLLLVLMRPREFLPLFWGCQLAGLVPVPLLPPVVTADSDEVRKLRGIWRRLAGPPVVVDDALVEAAGLLLAGAGPQPRVLGASALKGEVGFLASATPDPGALAMIQFTSGSTQAPRGVCLSHTNLLANVDQMIARAPLGSDEVELGWMPHSHDMGLIGCHLAPMRAGAAQIRMQPLHFLKRPAEWLDVATREGASLLTATDTSLRLVLRRLRGATPDRWDLSAVRHMFVGAEPVSPGVLAEVQRVFGPSGLRRGALRVAYGLAEASVGVAFPTAGDGDRVWRLSRRALVEAHRAEEAAGDDPDVLEVMDVGPPYAGVRVRIVDDADQPLPEGWVGHLQIQGPNVTAGYYEDPVATAAARCDAWWRTGDLAFLSGGRLAICGRVKETLYVAGRTLYAHDVESVATEVAGIRRAVACAVPGAAGSAEGVVLFVVVEEGAKDPAEPLDAVRRHVQRVMRLPLAQVVPLASHEIPRTSSGKIRRFRLVEQLLAGALGSPAEPPAATREAATEPQAPGTPTDAGAEAHPGAHPAPSRATDRPPLDALVARVWAEVLERDATTLPLDTPFLELGGSSLAAQEVLARLEEALGTPLDQDLLIHGDTLRRMAEHLALQAGPEATAARTSSPAPGRSRATVTAPPRDPMEPVAVVGLSCRVAGADTPDALWAELSQGKDHIGPWPAHRFGTAAAQGVRCQRGSFLADPYAFDPEFFGLDPAEATVLDPQQRLLLSLAVECLEGAGLGGIRRPPRVAVYVGANHLPHQEELLRPQLQREAFLALEQSAAFAALSPADQRRIRETTQRIASAAPLHPSALVGNLLNMLAARIAHELDLTGPAVALDTACSASLVAVHEACASLRRGECELALAGGVQLQLTASLYRYFEAAGALSPTGRSRPFAQGADGFVPGEGAGFVLLRPLGAALEAGDPIWAVIRGSAVNNDGRSLGAMAPNPAGQVAVMEAAYAAAGVDPAAVGLLECHGTGTAIGDPLELRALETFFGPWRDTPLPVGSVKSGYGHLLGAAGILGLLKAVLSLAHRVRPPSLHGAPAHPRLGGSTHLRLVEAAEDWTRPDDQPRVAAVSAFGFGGTNCHVVLEEAPAATDAAAPLPGTPGPEAAEIAPVLLALSAPTEAHLRDYAKRLAPHATAGPRGLLGELPLGRPLRPARATAVVSDARGLREALEGLAAGAPTGTPPRRAPRHRRLRVALLFAGQGTQAGLLECGLLRAWPAVAARFAALRAEAPGTKADAAGDEHRTDRAQPLLVAYQAAVAEGLQSLGLEPAAVLGHSLGELSAAVAIGVLPAELAVAWAARRGALMQGAPGVGGMLAVLAPTAQVEDLLPRGGEVVVAARNGPRQTVLSGPLAALAALAPTLEAAGLAALPVPVSHAFHSPLMAPMAAPFAAVLQGRATAPLALPLASTVTGRIHQGAALDPGHWVEQLTAPVRFQQAFEALAALPGVDAFLEIGPGATLARLAQELLPPGDPRPVLSLGARAERGADAAPWPGALEALGTLWALGAPLRLAPPLVPAPTVPRPRLPTLPYREQPLRLHPPPGAGSARRSPAAPEASSWWHRRAWRAAPLPEGASPAPGTWLLLGEHEDQTAPLAAALRGPQRRVVRAQVGPGFTRLAEERFALDPADESALRWLLEALGAGPPLAGLVYLLEPTEEGRDVLDAAHRVRALCRALHRGPHRAPVWGITRGAHRLPEDQVGPAPDQAACAALLLAAFAEEPDLHGGVIDLRALEASSTGDRATTAATLEAAAVLRALGCPGLGLRALRQGEWWAPTLAPWAPTDPGGPLRLGPGVHVVLGGTGGVGRALVRALHRAAPGSGATFLVTGRGDAAAVEATLAPLRREGIPLSYRRLVLPDAAGLAALLGEAETAHGRLAGVIHAAGIAPLGSLAQRRDEELHGVIGAKARSAAHLAAILASREVGYVALLSSVAAMAPDLGKGLADYAAANAFLDALAESERRAGRPWLSLAWTLWEDTGLGAALASAPAPLPVRPIPPSVAAERFLEALRYPVAHRVVLHPEDALRLSAAMPTGSGPAASRRARPAPGDETAAPLTTPAAGPPTTPPPPGRRPGVPPGGVEPFLRTLLAEALDVPPRDIDPEVPFQSLGLTSLAAVDLLKEVEAYTGLGLSTTLLFEHNRLGALVGYLEEALGASAAPQVAEAATAPSASELPLLPAQQTFYANHAFYPDMPGYVFLRLELTGKLVRAHLDRALAVLHERHEMLRVVFHWEGERLVQRPTGPGPVQVVDHDLRDLTPTEEPAALDAAEHALRNAVMDLELGPLLRVERCRLAGDRHSLMLSVHHIVADAWSAQILASELLTLHRLLEAGEPPSLPPLRSGFADGVRALAALDDSEEAAQSRRYWQGVLADPPPAPALPYDGDPGAAATGPCRLDLRTLPSTATAALAARARQWGTSPFEVLLASYLLALHRWSGQSDLVVRVANARREARLPDINRVVGCFADSLPLRVAVDPDAPLDALLRRVQRANLGARQHPHTSSLALAGIWGRRDHAGPRGVTPAGISFPDFAAPEQLGGLRVTGMRGGAASGFTQLGLIAWTFAGQLHLSWNTHEALFRPATVARLADEHLALLADLVRHGAIPGPRRHPVPTPVRTPAGADAPAVAAPPRPTRPARPAPLPPGAVVHQRLLAQLEAHPDRTAIVETSGEITAGALASAVRRLATALRERGAGPGTLVGILAHPGREATVGVLGILASGAAYVPLPPDYPDARLAQITRHARLGQLVTTADQQARLAAFEDTGLAEVLLLDPPEGDPRLAPPPPPFLRALHPWARIAALPPLATLPGEPQDLAYVMYTSGTTGDPKGVMVRHRAVSIFHDWVHAAFEVTPADRFIQTSSLGFGGSIRQIYSPLLAGAELHPAPRGLTRDPAALVAFLEERRITIWNSVPTLWMRLLDSVLALDQAGGPRTDLAHLRWILVGGEYVPAENVRRWMDRFGQRHRIANLYGSTETVVNATWHEVPGRPPEDAPHTPIGRARAGSEVHVLGPDDAPCAPGEVGEIVVGGPSLAAGYLHAPAETAAAFVTLPGRLGRVYRTGDLARRAPDGALVYLGRRDAQVKVRGNRVELQEIEAALLDHPAVRRAAVLEHTTAARQWLVAFVEAADPTHPPSAPALRAHLLGRLPEFMVPHRFETDVPIPLTPAGKLDRRTLAAHLASRHGPAMALLQPVGDAAPSTSPPPGGEGPPAAAPEVEDDAGEGAHGAPNTPTERILAEVWQAVLELERVERQDDFFALGGDSILALTVLQRLRGRVPVLPRPITLYGERTLWRLARVLDRLAAEGTGPEPAAVADPRIAPPPAGDDASPWREGFGRLALTPSQESFVLAHRQDPARAPVWCARIPVEGDLDPALLRRALEIALVRHPLLRAVVERDGLRTALRIHAPTAPPVVVEDLRDLSRAAQEARLDARFAQERARAFDLAAWPLWRMRLCRTGARAWQWFVTVHHVIGDGWSLQVLGADLLTIYDALAAGSPPELPALRGTWADVVAWHRQAREEADPVALRHWADTFATPWTDATVTPTPSDAPPEGPAGASADAPSPSRTLPPALREALGAAARARHTGLFSLVLTAWFRALRGATGQDALVVGAATSGRDLPVPDVERLFGCFATGLPLRVHLPRAEGRSADAHPAAGARGQGFDADRAAVEAALQAATRHGGVPVDVLLAQIPRHPGLAWPPGRRHFCSYMDFAALPAVTSRHLAVAWEEGAYHFAAQAAGTELMLGAQAGANLRLTLHGSAPRAIKEAALDALVADLEAVAAEATPAAPLAGARTAPPAAAPRLDAAIVGYLPAPARLVARLPGLGDPRELRALVRGLLSPEGGATLVETTATPLGVSGGVLLHRFADELADLPPARLAREVADAVALAVSHGARRVSLAGVLPSLTGYAVEVERALGAAVADPGAGLALDPAPASRLTTGHAATVVAVVRTLARVLQELGRSLPELHVAVLGYGSIGQAALALAIDVLGAPRQVTVCDLAQQAGPLARPLDALATRLAGRSAAPPRFLGLAAGAPLPNALFEADLILGATSAGDVLPVSRLRPGSVVVDDSFPPACDPAAAWQRMRTAGDVLVVTAGILNAHASPAVLVPGLAQALPEALHLPLTRFLTAEGLPGCRVEALLGAADPTLPRVLGLVAPDQARRFHAAALRHGLHAAPLQWDGQLLPAELLQTFRRHQRPAGHPGSRGSP